MTEDNAKQLVKKYFGFEDGIENTTIKVSELEDFVHFVESVTKPEVAAIIEVRDLLRFMFIDRQHTEVKLMHQIRAQKLHQNKHGIKENKDFRETNEDVATLQNYVTLNGVDIMAYLTPLLGRELFYIKDIKAQIDRARDKQTASQKSSEIDSTQGPESNMIITP